MSAIIGSWLQVHSKYVRSSRVWQRPCPLPRPNGVRASGVQAARSDSDDKLHNSCDWLFGSTLIGWIRATKVVTTAGASVVLNATWLVPAFIHYCVFPWCHLESLAYFHMTSIVTLCARWRGTRAIYWVDRIIWSRKILIIRSGFEYFITSAKWVVSSISYHLSQTFWYLLSLLRKMAIPPRFDYYVCFV